MFTHCNDANHCCGCDNDESCLFGTIGSHDADNERQDDENKCSYDISGDR